MHMHSALINQRYRSIRAIGQGGMGSVLLVEDTWEEGRLKALKTIRRDRQNPRSLAIFRNEFLSLAALPHPNLIRVYDFGIDEDSKDHFFTSEFIDGVDWLRAHPALDVSNQLQFRDLMDVLAQVLRALEFIHCRGLVHGDVKPENVLVVRETGAPGSGFGLRARIIDFGLVRRERTSGGKKVLGTPFYVAPETILRSPIDRRADLYSLGVLLYHITVGRPPFQGSENLAILKGHLEEEPVPPQQRVPGYPEELGAVVLRLMAKKPAQRYQSALEVIEALNASLGLSIPLETPETRASYLEAAELCGKEREAARLRGLLLTATGKRPQAAGGVEAAGGLDDGLPPVAFEEEPVPAGRLVILRGESGLGKRRLVEELRLAAQIRGVWFLAAECGGDPGELPAGLAAFAPPALEDPGGAPAGESAGSASPRRTAEGNTPSPAEQRLEYLKNLAGGIIRSATLQPLLLHFHDAHLASDDTLKLLGSLVEKLVEEKERRHPILITATALDRGEVEGSGFQRLADSPLFRNGALELQLARLDHLGVKRFIRSAFPGGAFPETFFQRVFEETDGNLQALHQVLSFLLARRRITRTAAGWALSPDYESDEIPGKVRRELMELISKLPGDALRLAMAFACLGGSAHYELATRLARIPGRAADASLQLLRRHKILQPGGLADDPGVFSLVHASAKTLLYRHLAPEELAATHERAGALWEERLQALGRHDPKVLAFHYLKARNRSKGIYYGIEAARALARELRPLESLWTYEEVLSLLGPEDVDTEKLLRREVAAIRFQVGDYCGVIDSLGELPSPSEIEGEGPWECLAYLLSARAQCRMGRFHEADLSIECADRLAARQQNPAARAPVLLAQAELNLYRGEWIASLRACNQLLALKDRIADPPLLSEIYMVTAENFWLLDDRERAASHCQLGLRLIDSQNDAWLLSLSLFCRGKLYLYQHQLTEAIKQFQLCLLMRRKMNALDGQAECLLELGAIHHALGAPQDACSLLEEAASLFEKTANLPRWAAAQSLLAESLRLVGEHQKCHRAIGDALRRAGPLGIHAVALQALATFAGLCIDRGDLRSAERYLGEREEREAKGPQQGAGRVWAHALSIEQALQAGKLGAALSAAERGVAAARQLGNPALQARMLAQQAYLLLRLGKGGEARRDLVTLLDLSKRRALPGSEGWARLVEGMILAQEGKEENAGRLFQQAREILGAYGGERDLVELHLAQGMLHLGVGRHEDAYLNFKEGLELAENLELGYQRTRLHGAIALLEMELSSGPSPRVEANLRAAWRLADRASYIEIRWQILLSLGKLLLRSGRDQEAKEALELAAAGLEEVLAAIPPSCRESYRRVTRSEDLVVLLREVSANATPAH